MPKIDIDAEVPKWGKKQKIPPTTTLFKRESDLEAENFLISFMFYNDKVCEIDRLDQSKGRKAVHCLRLIGSCSTFEKLKNNSINIIRIENKGEYKKLFNRLTLDVDIREHKIQGSARLFYFIVDKLFNIVAITNRHFETKKHR